MQNNNICLTNSNSQSMLVLLSINKFGIDIHYWSTRYDSSEKLRSLNLKNYISIVLIKINLIYTRRNLLRKCLKCPQYLVTL